MKECKYGKYCGGCNGIEKDFNIELNEKKQKVEKLFSSICDNVVEKCIGDFYPYKYRNKIHLAFAELKGKTLIGFFEENSCRVVDIDSCMLFGDWSKTLITILREFVSRFRIKAFNGETGIIRYAHARCIDNRLQLTLVVVSENFAGRSWLMHELKKHFVDVSFYININKRTDRQVFDKIFKFVDGTRFLNFNVCGVKVSLHPSSFLQVNLSIAEKMYREAVNLLDIKKTTTVIDLYSGIGITSIMFARLAKNVISIEEVVSACESAKHMCLFNNVKNVKVCNGKCEQIISSIVNSEDMVVFLDPARIGIDFNVINSLKKISPRKIVYMSCNPESCLKDINAMVDDNKYSVTAIKPYNMFPFTNHIECLVLLDLVLTNK